jgi:hypothetical protein
MAVTYKYYIVATGLKGGLPDGGGDTGKGGLAGDQGEWGAGFKQKQGDPPWIPNGLAIVQFNTEGDANAWLASDASKWLRDRYKGVILARVTD